MRRKWYLAFGLVLIFLILRAIIWGHADWLPFLIVPMIVITLYDFFQKKHTILRNFPFLGHFRFLMEFVRPEIQQYFIANDEQERPFNRETRSIIYERAKGDRDTIPFGTSKDIMKIGYSWVLHSLAPKSVDEVEGRLLLGGPSCKKPYLASRLNISAMSFGSLSENAIIALNQGAKIGDFSHNTGEGGLTPYHLQGGAIIFQLGTAYFSCRDDQGRFDENLFSVEANRDEVKGIEIKLSQGAKPSHGGILPAAKVTPEIAAIRKIKMGQDVLSPPAHTAFTTPVEMMLFIQKLRDLTGGKPIGFKLCLGRKEDFFALCKAMLITNILPDFITVDGAEGGTGAAPQEFANHMGEPLEAGLIFVHNALVGIGLRDKIKIICSGKIASGFDMVLRVAMGADFCNSARAMMMSLGCVQAKQCNANTCPTGITTQNRRLQRGLVIEQKKHRVAAYHQNTIHSFLEIVGAMGLSDPSHLNPDYIMRRVSNHISKPLSEIYDYLKPGDLLGPTIPSAYKKYWDLADPNRF